MSGQLIEHARRLAGLTQTDLAELAGTSRPTLSAYESGRKSPTLATAERILTVAGFTLSLDPAVEFQLHHTERGRPFYVANRLWRLPVERAMATVVLPLHLNWSTTGQQFDMRNRRQRLHCYEILLREGDGRDIMTFVDGALLIDVWPDVHLPRVIKDAWTRLIDEGHQ
ncbi:MAG: helix-turn-helix domain-containing protein [Acidobacteria bacterium]|nr:helix-turn-helix domain-containing protein [Acidobacteriota bacterium]